MFNLRCNNRGIGLVEVVIAIFLTTVGVLAVLSLQPAAWRTATRSDYMGRAAGILQKELETREACIMNACNTVTVGTAINNVFVSGKPAAQPGDATFTVTSTTATVTANAVWRVSVRVAWLGHPGIIESLLVTRQQNFTPTGCPSPAVCPP
jgi:Tfp pilus assembly protein PilV